MPVASLSDYVTVFDDVLAVDQCAALIERFEASTDQELCQRDTGHSFTQINVTKCWPDQHDIIWPVFMSHFTEYRTKTEAYFWPPEFAFEHVRMKRYLPNGRDCFPPHVDVMGQVSARRFMTAMIYLNAPEAGETEFTSLGISVAPATGKLVAFPPLWLFPHAGLPPRSSPKYILHTYLCYGA